VPTPLSSAWTPFYKFALPFVIGGGMLVATVVAYLRPESMNGPDGWPREYVWVATLAFGALMVFIVWWFGGRALKVDLDDDELILSDYRSETRVRLANLEAISGPTITNPPRYTLTFTEPTEFGRTVTFIPPQDFGFQRDSEKRAISELKEAWAAARSKR